MVGLVCISGEYSPRGIVSGIEREVGETEYIFPHFHFHDRRRIDSKRLGVSGAWPWFFGPVGSITGLDSFGRVRFEETGTGNIDPR